MHEKFLKKILFSLLLLATSSSLFAQSRSVKGKVIDSKDGSPLSGATITISGTNLATQSGGDGSFQINNVPPSATKIVVTYIGYSESELDIVDANMVVRMATVSGLIDDIVVIGYASVKKKDLTGAAATISAKDFNKGPQTSPDQLIQGKVAGVQMINNSGQPGGASTVRIRGNSAITGSGQPLYVVDGVALTNANARPSNSGGVGKSPDGNPLNFMNPADIESMEILKDASATAIYGSRGAYGVVLITTKRGKSGQPKLDISASTGFSKIAKKLDILDADGYREALKKYSLTTGDIGSSVDAMDAILQTGINQNYSVSVSGGQSGNTYRTTLGYQDMTGIIKSSSLKKYTASLNGNFKLLDTKKLGIDVLLTTSQYLEGIAPITTDAGFEGSLISHAISWNPTRPLYNPDGSFLILGDKQPVNPLAMMSGTNDKSRVSTILGNISPYYKITPWLDFRMLASMNYSTGIRRSSTKSFVNLSTLLGSGYASYSNTELITKQFTNTLNFNKAIARNLNLNAIIGYEYTGFTNKGITNSATGFGAIPVNVDYVDVFQGTNPSNRSVDAYFDPTSELQSFFARTIFNFKGGRYLLTATIRADGSSKFGSENRYGYFPSFAAAWDMKKEDFMQNTDFLNQLKLRVGFGVTGNQDFPSGSSQQRYGYTFTNGKTATKPINNANPSLKWQSDVQSNIGIDYALAKNKITGSIDYFHKKTKDLLFPEIPFFPAISGVPVWKNLQGEIINSGIEFSINANIVRNNDWEWSLGANATFIKNKVSGLSNTIYTGALNGNGLSGVNSEVIKNELPLFALNIREFTGLDASGISVYKDNASLFYVGNPNPKVVLGISSSVNYKKLSFTANFNGAFGQDIYNNTANSVLAINNLGKGNIESKLVNQEVLESQTNPVTASSRYVENGSYLKLANATISYGIGNMGTTIKGLNIYINGQNLFVLTKYSGFDPEVNVNKSVNGVPSAGIDYITYPSARTINLGVNFSL